LVRTISTFTWVSRAAIAPRAASTGAKIVTTPPTATPVVSGTSKSTSPSWLRIMRRRTLPSSMSSFVLWTSSLAAISMCSVQVCSSFSRSPPTLPGSLSNLVPLCRLLLQELPSSAFSHLSSAQGDSSRFTGHRAVLRVSSEVEDVADQQKESCSCARPPASRPDDGSWRHQLSSLFRFRPLETNCGTHQRWQPSLDPERARTPYFQALQ
jgi:hypothetical protein